MAMINGYPVINDAYSHPVNGRGYTGRDLTAYPLGKCGGMYAEPIFTDQQIRDIIVAKDADKSWITDHCDRIGLTVKNQQNSNYCWNHAPIHGAEVCYCMAGDGKIVLSAFYGAAIIKNGRNQGGSGIVGIEWNQNNGACTEALHPSMDFSTNNSAEAKADALRHKIIGYEEIEPSDHRMIQTAVCCNHGVTVGIPDWGHEVLIVRLTIANGKIMYIIDNSWGTSWGNNGRGILEGRRTIFDEAGVIRSCTPSLN